MTKRVLDIGACEFDNSKIRVLVEAAFDAKTVAAASAEDGWAALAEESFDLVLINRVIAADGDDGLKLLKRIKADASLACLPVMLVSNFPQAQAEAVAAGAEPGFGKAELDWAETRRKLEPFLG